MATPTYPNRANTQGFPLLEGSAAIDGANLVISFQPHAYLGTNWTGGFWVKVTGAVVTGAQPAFFATVGQSNSQTPLYLFNGSQATAADLVTTGPGIFLCFWDASSQRLQMLV